MARARGANATLVLATEGLYGTPPGSGFRRTPFVSANLGEEQPLLASNLLGRGRGPQKPGQDSVDNVGDVVVPMCMRNFGFWLKLLLGVPTTATGLSASGSILFNAQPANNATISLAGTDFTFTTGAATGAQIKIGANLSETVVNAVRALNASTVPAVAAARFLANDRGNGILIEHEALGIAGNSYALAASSSPASGATVSGGTLSGGAASGGYRHTFETGAAILPSASAEVGFPEVPFFGMNWGVKVNTLGIQMQRGGQLDVTLNLIAQGETTGPTSEAGTVADELPVDRFSQFSGSVRRNGVPVADLVSGQLNMSNGLDPVPAIRTDGRIGGVDEGALTVTGQIGVRFSGPELQMQAENGEPCELEYQWSLPNSPWSLRIIIHEVYLPKAKRPITGPGGVQADYAWQAADPVGGRAATFILTNDVPGATYV